MSRLRKLIREVHQRSLWQALVVYLGASWAVLEAVALFSERYALPPWLFNLALAALLIGLPVVVIASLTAEERYGDEVSAESLEAAADEDRRLRLLTWRNAGLALLGALAVWGVIAAGWIVIEGKPGAADYLAGRAKLVVLPFENLGDPEDEYFADGVTEEITSRLAQVSGVAIVGRTTAKNYKHTDKTIPEIGAELNADYVLEGTVRWEKTQGGQSRVRVTPQLVWASKDTHLWSDRYDADFADIFEIQTQIAENVLGALSVSLRERERARLRVQPTDNPQAYEYYLQAQGFTGQGLAGRRIKEEAYQRAVDLDPNFALAWAAFSYFHSGMKHNGYDASEERMERARQAAERAIELDPELPAGYYALGVYWYWGYRDYDRALEQFAVVEQLDPSAPGVPYWTGLIQRRQGKWEEAVRSFERSFALDPQGTPVSRALASTLYPMREYDRAERYVDFYLELGPMDRSAYGWKAMGHLARDGDKEKALETLRLKDARTGATPPGRRAARIFFDEYRDYIESLTLLTYFHPEDTAAYYLLKATYYEMAEEEELRLAYYDSARWIANLWLQDYPDMAYLHRVLGEAYAGLGHKDDAIREGQMAVELNPVSRDALSGPGSIANLARIYMMVGEYDAAIDQLEYLLSIPSSLSIPLLRIDPLWDPLRDHPRFQSLLESGQ